MISCCSARVGRPVLALASHCRAASLSFHTAGNLVRRTIGRADAARRPTFSPDGTELALSLADDFVIDVYGNVVLHGSGAYTTWSPHGSYIAYTDGGLWIRNLQTGATVVYAHTGECGIDIARENGTNAHRLTRVC
jgi:hypothetical protein